MKSLSKAAFSMPETRREVFGVLCSGRGTDLQSIIDAIGRGDIDASIGVVITDKPNVMALERAHKAGIQNVCVPRRDYDDRENFERAMIAELEKNEVTSVICAGFMRILSPYFVHHYAGRIINIHPALLPSFPGAHAHRDVLAYGVKVSGCTVHFVDEGTDSGPIIMQKAVPVLDDDTEETLAARVLKEEHIIFPKAVSLYADGRLRVDGRHVTILPANPKQHN